MKEVFIEAEIELVHFEAVDVITTSNLWRDELIPDGFEWSITTPMKQQLPYSAEDLAE